MYSEEEEAPQAYLEATDGSRYLAPRINYKPTPDFEGFFKNAFHIIDELDVPEVTRER